NPSSISLGDFHGDRKPDMAVANLTPDTISVLLNTCQSAKFNHRPIALSQAFSVNEGAEVEITLYASDADNDAVIYTVADPTHGTLSGTPPNLVYRPALHYIGPDGFTFTVNDGKTNHAPATISITVLPPNHTPVVQSPTLSFNEDSGVDITLFASDADNDPLTYTVTRPTHGTFSGTPPNLVYQPALHYFGPDSFTFEVN